MRLAPQEKPERILSPLCLEIAAGPHLDLPGRRRYAVPIPQKGVEREWLLSDLVRIGIQRCVFSRR